jgi:hypothetical protein
MEEKGLRSHVMLDWAFTLVCFSEPLAVVAASLDTGDLPASESFFRRSLESISLDQAFQLSAQS